MIENRIFDLAKDDVSDLMAEHIIIIGCQSGIGKLVSLLSMHYPLKNICIFTEYSFSENKVIQYLKMYKNLYHFKGIINNPKHLLRSGINNASYCFLLFTNLNERTKDDINKILAFKSIDYFYNCNSIIELWDYSSKILLGFNPLGNYQSILNSEFFHPFYISGKLIYLNHLNRLICIARKDKNKIDAWIELLNLGYKVSNNGTNKYKTKLMESIRQKIQKTTNKNNINCNANSMNSFNLDFLNKRNFSKQTKYTFDQEKKNKAVLITTDLPKEYENKEYFDLFTDFLCQRTPILILGIYIENPIDYVNIKNDDNIQNNGDNTNRKQITNVDNYSQNEKSLLYYIEKLYENSYNDKISLEFVDLKHPFFPIFITNPPPWFLLKKGIKLLVLFNFEAQNKSRTNLKDYFSYLISSNEDGRRFDLEYTNHLLQKKKQNIQKRQEQFYKTLNLIKEKMEEKYLEAFKVLERKNTVYRKTTRKSP